MNKSKLNSEYVRAYYEKTVGGLNASYADFRWFSSAYVKAEYNQTKRAIVKALNNRRFDSALEVGGGDGVWTELLFPRAAQITELDISEEMIKSAKKRFGARGNVKFLRGDFLDNGLPSGSYDLVYAIRCFEYFQDKDKAVSEMRRLLGPEGRVLVVTKNPHYITHRRGEKKTLHRGQISQDDLTRLFVRRGFRILESNPAILGKKFDIAPARVLFGALHFLSLSKAGFLVPWPVRKYISESYLVFAQKLEE